MGYHLADAQMNGTDIISIKVAGGENSLDTLSFKGNWFIDASYEGDLMAKAGVSYRTGREDCSEYGETWNGVHMRHMHQFPDGVDPYVIPGDPSSGLLWGISEGQLAAKGSGDNLIQAYNYRICLTNNPENRIPIEKPENYDPSKYELLVRVFEAQKDMREINQYFIWSLAPNQKTDVNNRGAFSTDMIGMNHNYPEATWEERQEIIKAHKDYTLGLLYFYATDPRVPAELQNHVKEWGLPKDEYVENGHWTPQLYVRECRRMVGEYVATQADCDNKVIAPEGIAYAAYTMDSHNTQRIVIEKNGKKIVKGFDGGLLGHWSVWTKKAVELFEKCKAVRGMDSIPYEMMTLANEVTDTNAAFFDTANNFKGCIAGLHEVLRRQGIFKGIWCLNPEETMSEGQLEEIDRIYKMYPHLNDDDFIKANLDKWLAD
jgi:hypothetical protein